jgi:hypothetical protein
MKNLLLILISVCLFACKDKPVTEVQTEQSGRPILPYTQPPVVYVTNLSQDLVNGVPVVQTVSLPFTANIDVKGHSAWAKPQKLIIQLDFNTVQTIYSPNFPTTYTINSLSAGTHIFQVTAVSDTNSIGLGTIGGRYYKITQ